MHLPITILAITPTTEKPIYYALDLFTACVEAMKKNMPSMSQVVTYVIVRPNGKRMTINEQRKYLSFVQENR